MKELHRRCSVFHIFVRFNLEVLRGIFLDADGLILGAVFGSYRGLEDDPENYICWFYGLGLPRRSGRQGGPTDLLVLFAMPLASPEPLQTRQVLSRGLCRTQQALAGSLRGLARPDAVNNSEYSAILVLPQALAEPCRRLADVMQPLQVPPTCPLPGPAARVVRTKHTPERTPDRIILPEDTIEIIE